MKAYERETSITLNDEEDVVRIWSYQAPFVRRIRDDDRFTITEEGVRDGAEYVAATIHKSQWRPWSGLKRRARPMTEEERQRAAQRLAEGRKARLTEGG